MKIVIVYFMLVFKFDIGYGNRREISMSKIKNKIMIRKNCIENEGMTGVWVIKPHSKVFHFCNVISVIKVITLISNNMTLTNRMFIEMKATVVIFYYEPHQYRFK